MGKKKGHFCNTCTNCHILLQIQPGEFVCHFSTGDLDVGSCWHGFVESIVTLIYWAFMTIYNLIVQLLLLVRGTFDYLTWWWIFFARDWKEFVHISESGLLMSEGSFIAKTFLMDTFYNSFFYIYFHFDFLCIYIVLVNIFYIW